MITSFFWSSLFSEIGPYFCRLVNKWTQVQSQKKIAGSNSWAKISIWWAVHMCAPKVRSCYAQVLGRLFAPSQKSKKLSHQFRVCFELGIGILNAPRKIFFAVYEPILKLQGLEGFGFQGKNCFTKMVSNFSKIDCGIR